jgi:hypothetical protein
MTPRTNGVGIQPAPTPRATTSRCKSANDQRASGTPTSIGRSQAIRFTSTMTVGGKAGWTPAARLLIEAREAVLEEAMAPFADNLPWRIQPHADLVVAETGGGEEHDLGADDVTIR